MALPSVAAVVLRVRWRWEWQWAVGSGRSGTTVELAFCVGKVARTALNGVRALALLKNVPELCRDIATNFVRFEVKAIVQVREEAKLRGNRP